MVFVHSRAWRQAIPFLFSCSAILALGLYPHNTEQLASIACQKIGFVHVPKTGGSSIIKMLRSDPITSELLLPTLRADSYGAYHSPAVEQSTAFGSLWQRSITFSMVRNPFLLIGSYFMFAQDFCPEIKALDRNTSFLRPRITDFHICEYFLDHYFYPPGSNFSIVQQTFTKYVQESLRRSLVQSTFGKALLRNDKPEVSQLAWLTGMDGQTMLVDFFIRLEEISSFSFQVLLKCTPSFNTPTILVPPHVLRSRRHSRYWDLYNEKACMLVARYLKDDFAAFGYNTTECLQRISGSLTG